MSFGTSLYEPGVGFIPPRDFFVQPYVFGFAISVFDLMRVNIFKGGGWSPMKRFEYMLTAFSEFQGLGQDIARDDFAPTFNALQGNEQLKLGAWHGGINFAAMVGQANNFADDPIIIEACSNPLPDIDFLTGVPAADPTAGFTSTVLMLTVGKFMEETFPSA